MAVTSGAVSPMAISATTAAPTPCYMHSSPAKAPTPQRFPTSGGEAWDFAEKELAVSFDPCPASLPSFAVHLAQRTPHDDAPLAMHALPAPAVATVPLPAVFSGYPGGCRVSGSHAGHGPGPYDGVPMEESHDSVHPEASTRLPPAVVLAEVPSAMFHDDEASVSGADEQPAAPAPPRRRMSLAPQHVGAFLDDVLVIDNALDLEEDAEEAEEEESW